MFTRFIQTPSGVGLMRFYYSPEFEHKQKPLISGLMVYTILVGAVFAIGFNFIVPDLVTLVGERSEYFNESFLFSFLPLLVLMPLSAFILTFFRITERVKYYAIISIVRIVCELVAALIFIYVYNTGVTTMVYAHIVGVSLVCFIGLPYLLKNFVRQVKWMQFKQVFAYSIPLLPSAYSEILVKSGDRYIIKSLMSFAAVGVYSVAYQIASLVEFLLSKPLEQAFQPLAFRHEKSPKTLREVTQKALDIFVFVGTIICLSLSIFAKDILRVFARGPEYVEAWVVIPVVALSILVKGISKFSGMGLVMAKKSGLQSTGMVIAAICNIIFNLILIPIYGIMGAAIATFLAYLVWNIWKAYFSFKFYQLKFNWAPIIKLIMIGCLHFLIFAKFVSSMPVLPRLSLGLVVLTTFVLVIWFSNSLAINTKEETLKLLSKLKSKLGI